MVATFEREAALLELMRLSQAVVPGEGGGKTDPMIGVSPVPGVKPVRGVSPVRKVAGSKLGSGWSLLLFGWGPASIAGERGPDLSELDKPADEKPHA